MKHCSKCKETKPKSKFFKNSARMDGLQSHCKDCKRKVDRAWHEKDFSKRRKLNRKRRKELHEFVDELKTNPCMDCKRSFPPECMDFDHLKDKIAAISRMIADFYSKESILEEIKKCELICACCHRIRTKKRRQGLL